MRWNLAVASVYYITFAFLMSELLIEYGTHEVDIRMLVYKYSNSKVKKRTVLLRSFFLLPLFQWYFGALGIYWRRIHRTNIF